MVLLQETQGMTGRMYQRPPFPATWARRHGSGRVFFTSLGHREDVWTNPTCWRIILAGFAWILSDGAPALAPNIDKVAPQANQLTR